MKEFETCRFELFISDPICHYSFVESHGIPFYSLLPSLPRSPSTSSLIALANLGLLEKIEQKVEQKLHSGQQGPEQGHQEYVLPFVSRDFSLSAACLFTLDGVVKS